MKNTLLIFILTLSTFALAQAPITVENPSFEDVPRHSHLPIHWGNCGQEGETPPDIHPDITFSHEMLPAAEGETYVGMVTRDNATCECMFAELNAPLLQDRTYRFTLALMRFPAYMSISRLTGNPVNYITPAVLQIWGAKTRNGMEEFLAETPAISHPEWEYYEFTITPKEGDVNYIVLQAYYADEQQVTNGNLALDHLSDFTPVMLSLQPGFTQRVKAVDAPPIEPAIIDEVWLSQARTDNELEMLFEEELLPGMRFIRDQTLDKQEYQVMGSEVVFLGNPWLYSLVETLNHNGRWELVVYHDDQAVEDVRLASIQEQLEALENTSLTVRAFTAKLDKGAEYFASSKENGLYLNRLE